MKQEQKLALLQLPQVGAAHIQGDINLTTVLVKSVNSARRNGKAQLLISTSGVNCDKGDIVVFIGKVLDFLQVKGEILRAGVELISEKETLFGVVITSEVIPE